VPNGNDTTVVSISSFEGSEEKESTETVVKPTPKTYKTNATIKTITRHVAGIYPQDINLCFVKYTITKTGRKEYACECEGCTTKSLPGKQRCAFHEKEMLEGGSNTQKKKTKWTSELEEELLRLAKTFRKNGNTDWDTLWENAMVLQEAGYALQQCKSKYLKVRHRGLNK
jgi:hypothetical protein